MVKVMFRRILLVTVALTAACTVHETDIPGLVGPSGAGVGTPTAGFTFAPTPTTVNVPVVFEAFATPGAGATEIQSYIWEFGDGAVATGKLVSRTYLTQKTYNVTLTVTDNRGASSWTTRAVTVGAEALPTASFFLSPSNVVVGQTVFANASASKAAVGHVINSYRWEWGDGESGGGAIGDHDYAAAGSYTVMLIVTDDAGQTATATQTVTIQTANPIAKLTLIKGGGLVITADGSLSTAAGGAQIVNYSFNWGDASTTSGTGSVVSHTFPALGTYTVTLTVTDDFVPPRTGTVTATVTVP